MPFTLASKNPNLSRIPMIRVFSLKVARQLPLNTKKKTNRKTHLRSVIFWNSTEISLFFFANVNARSNLAGIIRVFGHVIRDLQRNHQTTARDVMRTTRVRSKVERSRSCAPLTKTQVWDSGFFAHALFVPKTPNVMGFSGSVNGTTKNPGFLDFGFCQCKWGYGETFNLINILEGILWVLFVFSVFHLHVLLFFGGHHHPRCTMKSVFIFLVSIVFCVMWCDIYPEVPFVYILKLFWMIPISQFSLYT